MAPRINRSMRLPEQEHFPPGASKTGIAIHHTVGRSASSTFRWWMQDNQMVGTAFIIDRNGTIFEVFDPTAWAWQFGLKWSRVKRIQFEKRFIGIELASEGALIESEGNLYCFDRVSDKTLKRREEAFDFGGDYRGYRYFDRYEDAQVDSLLELMDYLCDQFQIRRHIPEQFFDYYGEKLADFEGIIGHAMIRKDKSDPAPDRSLWDRIINTCGATKSKIGTPNGLRRRIMTDEEIEQLFEHNVQQINQMNIAAGSMVKGLIMELERGDRGTYIKLNNPTIGGHAIDYTFVQGDKSLVGRIARALGFKTVTESKLEVRSA